MGTGSRSLLAAFALMALALPATGAMGADPLPLPDADPFYAAPPKKRLKHASPGRVLRARAVDLSASDISVPHRAWQLLYRTADSKGRPEAAVATLIVPEAGYEGRRPLLAYQPAEDTLTRRCASSYELRTGSGAEPSTFSMGLERGWAVVVPDYEGPESQWVAGAQAGHAVLDGVRAAERFRGADLGGRKTPVGIWGYSGGGHATAWASELQPRYAPELRVRGVAHGGAAADPEATARNVDGGPASGLILAAAVGISRAYPEMGLDALLNDAGHEMVRRIGEMCLEEFVAAYPFRRMNEFTIVPDPLAVPSVRRIIQKVGLGRRRPGAPLYIYHAIADELNPISASDALVERYCSMGVPVAYYRSPAGEHIAVQDTGADGAVAYLADRLAGGPAPTDC